VLGENLLEMLAKRRRADDSRKLLGGRALVCSKAARRTHRDLVAAVVAEQPPYLRRISTPNVADTTQGSR